MQNDLLGYVFQREKKVSGFTKFFWTTFGPLLPQRAEKISHHKKQEIHSRWWCVWYVASYALTRSSSQHLTPGHFTHDMLAVDEKRKTICVTIWWAQLSSEFSTIKIREISIAAHTRDVDDQQASLAGQSQRPPTHATVTKKRKKCQPSLKSTKSSAILEYTLNLSILYATFR